MSKHVVSSERLSRRAFFKQSALAASLASLTGCSSTNPGPLRPRVSSQGKLRLGFIGAGGRGWENLQELASEEIVALCDVDSVRAQNSFARYPDAKRYTDFRVMLEREPSLEAVVVSTPDHTHAAAAIWAMRH